MAATFSSLQSTVGKLSARLTENLAESARDLGFQQGLEGVVGSSARTLAENGTLATDEGARETRKLLESPRDREREEGLKRVLALMIKGRAVAGYFPYVTNCLSSQSVQVRSLVSLFVVRQAALEPDLALLSVNMYQKDLGDPNPVVRAMALRVLSGMGLEAIAGLVAMCLRRASRDGSWHVRRAAAVSCSQLLQLDRAHKSSLIPVIETLLADRSPLVIGAAAAAFEGVCPERLDLLHPRYRSLCRLLVDADEWGQVAVLNLLARYARLNFLDPNRPRDDPSRSSAAVDADLDLLLRSCEPLFLSQNVAVVATACKAYYHLGPAHLRSRIVRPLLRLLHTSQEIQGIVLEDIYEVVVLEADLFTPFIQQFYIRGADTLHVKRAKLRCLAILATPSNVRGLLRELLEYTRDADEVFAADTIKAIGECASRLPDIAEDCVNALLELVKGSSGASVSQAVVVVIGTMLGAIPAQSKVSRPRIVGQLVYLLQSDRLANAASARAHIYWLIGQHADEGLLESLAPDTLRQGVKTFASEATVVKLQLLNLGARLVLAAHQTALGTHTRILSLLFDHLSSLARYDLEYEVRDRARFLKGLVASCGLAYKAADSMPMDAFSRGEDAPQEHIDAVKLTPKQVFAVLYASRAVPTGRGIGMAPPKALSGWAHLPPWATQRSASSLRDSAEADGPSPKALSANGLTSTQRVRATPSPTGDPRASSPVVLTPRNASPAPRAAVRPRDLNDFLASEESESESEEETDESEDDSDAAESSEADELPAG